MTIHDSSLEAGAPRVSTRIHGALITRTAHVRATRRVRPAHRVSGTGSSNPFPSRGESCANLTAGGAGPDGGESDLAHRPRQPSDDGAYTCCAAVAQSTARAVDDRTKGCCSSDLNEPPHPNHDQFAELDAHNSASPVSAGRNTHLGSAVYCRVVRTAER